jgi:hypothetical protein
MMKRRSITWSGKVQEQAEWNSTLSPMEAATTIVQATRNPFLLQRSLLKNLREM